MNLYQWQVHALYNGIKFTLSRVCQFSWNPLKGINCISCSNRISIVLKRSNQKGLLIKSRRDKLTQREWWGQLMERNYTHLLDITPTIHKNDKVVKTDQRDSCISNSGMPALHQWNRIHNFNSLSICRKCPERD